MKVYFVRHGQSEGNLLGIHQNHATKLTPEGKQQAQQVAQRFVGVDIDLIFTSDYVRAFHTAEAINEQLNLEMITNELLREIKRPTELEGKKYGDPDTSSIKEQILENRHDPDWRYSDEETFFDMADRAQQFIHQLEERSEEHILCVAHGNIIRNIVMSMVLGEDYSPSVYEQIKRTMVLKNTGVTLCEYKDGFWRLKTWNDCTHLS